jgi:hypothetical protein
LPRGWIFHGLHLTASAVYGRELYASMDVAFYGVICVAFPLVGVAMSMIASATAIVSTPLADGGPQVRRGRRAGWCR